MTEQVAISRSHLASESAEEAWETLSRMYTGARPRTTSPEAAIVFDTVATPEIAVDRGWLAAARGAFDPSPDQVNLITVLSGRISLDFGRHGARTNLAGDSYVYLPDSSADLCWDAFHALTVRLPTAQVMRAAAEMTGTEDTVLGFMSMSPISMIHRRLWHRIAQMLWQQLSDPGSFVSSPLAHQELLNVTSAAVISIFPNAAIGRDEISGPGAVRPSVLRRAVGYIDANASLPITVTDIAHAVGTSPRDLHHAFRRHLDMTPTAYLRHARLEAARADLLAVDPDARDSFVPAIAARWGFLDPAQFHSEWIRVYGGPPDHLI